MTTRPTGTVTFLFSDIEGSAVRWDGAPEAMESALARHDAIVRRVIESHDGYVFKTMGDAFCAAFATARDAMAAALEAQRALAVEDFSAVKGIRVRMALHTGRSTERDGDYFGPAVNRVARLLAIAHGGQVLLSGTAVDSIQDEPMPNCSLRDLGAHRLKDLAEPEYVYQLIAPDLPEAFPALVSLDHLSNNLPAQLTSFVGRADVMSEVKALLEQHRLVTLVGTGGAGKTRCAIQLGAEFLDGSPDGVWLAALAAVSDPSLVASVVARALNVPESPNRPMLDTLVAYLKRKQLLLILDNCEHVIEEARRVAADLLRGCPGLRILATSREALNIAGEEAYRIPSLAIPSNVEASSSEVSRYGAVQLFADRALSVDKRFTLNDENAGYIADICRRVDGIPLAIELAAARVKVLSPKQLVQKLNERFRVLTGGDRTALPRHQTMRALIDWSYDLLSDDERRVFRKLSIFAAGATLETASAVCMDEAIDEIAMFDLLASLVDKSLLQTEEVHGATRYRLLESTREYGRERLAEAGEEVVALRAHADAFLALGEELNSIFETSPERQWLGQAEPEMENFRAALSWALEARGDILLGQRLAAALRPAWTRLAAAEGRRQVQAARELASRETPLSAVAALDLAEAALATALGQSKAAHALAERALARYAELDDPLPIAQARHLVGRALVHLGDVDEGEVRLTEALAEARALEAPRVTGDVLQSLAIARNAVGDVAGARSLFVQALATSRAVGAENVVANLAGNLAEAEFHGGNAAEALHLEREALANYRGVNNALGVAIALSNIAAYFSALERYDEARVSGREGLAAARDAQWEAGVAWGLQHLAAVGALRSSGELEQRHTDCLRAAHLLGYIDARLEVLDALRGYTEQQEYDKTLTALRDTLDADNLSKLTAEGSTWSEDQAVAEAMLI